MDAAAFAGCTGISEAQRQRFEIYAALLLRWQGRVNLVARSTLPVLWQRHFFDSAQLLPLIPAGARSLVDLGSGAGFPGLVLALLGVPEVHLIEADQRKAVFLAEVSRETATPLTIHAQRLDRVPAFPADVVTARALAPLPELLAAAARFAAPHTVALFPKGRDVDKELTALPEAPKMRVERFPSLTDPAGTLLRIQGFGRD